MLDSNEYAERNGLSCPVCASDNMNTTGRFVSRDDLKVELHIWCEDCRSHWDDIYSLEGYEELKTVEGGINA